MGGGRRIRGFVGELPLSWRFGCVLVVSRPGEVHRETYGLATGLYSDDIGLLIVRVFFLLVSCTCGTLLVVTRGTIYVLLMISEWEVSYASAFCVCVCCMAGFGLRLRLQ